MAHIYFTFDFGNDEEKVQQARHKLDSLKQSFRLDKKLLYKFDRGDANAGASEEPARPPAEKKAGGKQAAESEGGDGKIRVLLRLAMPPHEKLTLQRLLERIPAEAPLDSASPKLLREGDPEFVAVEERFESLD